MKTVFFHLPKTAGSALVKSLHRAYFNWRRPLARYHFGVCPRASLRKSQKETFETRIAVAEYAMNLRGVDLVTGHMPYFDYRSRVNNSEEWLSAVVLRNPVDRWLSEYFYNYGKESPHLKIQEELSKYLESDRARVAGQLYCRWFSSGSGDVETAIGNLEQIDCLGFQENLDGFAEELSKRVNKRLKLDRVNIRPKSQRGKLAEVSDAEMRRVEELCKDDIKIYEHFTGNPIDSL